MKGVLQLPQRLIDFYCKKCSNLERGKLVKNIDKCYALDCFIPSFLRETYGEFVKKRNEKGVRLKKC